MSNALRDTRRGACHHPPLEEVEQLLLCRRCHQSKAIGLLTLSGGEYALKGGPLQAGTFALPLMDLVDPGLIGKRVRVTIEFLSEEEEEEVKAEKDEDVVIAS
jgi:hypothetical protein